MHFAPWVCLLLSRVYILIMAAVAARARAGLAALRAANVHSAALRAFSSRILCSDPIDAVATDILHKAGFEVEQVDATKLSEDELLAMMPNFDGLIVRRCDLKHFCNFRRPGDHVFAVCSGTTVTPKLIDAASNLKLIGRAGVGIDNIDLDAATRKYVCSLTCGLSVRSSL